MEKLLQDFRYALRTLRRSPGFSLVVIISIALGFAANATVFSVANGLLWGVLPVRDPGRVVMFSEGESFSYPDYIDYRDQTKDIFDGGVAAHFPLIPASIGGNGDPERVWGQAVSGNFFSVLSVPMVLGRPISEQDDQSLGRDRVAVLSNKLWRRRFAADPNILNREVALNVSATPLWVLRRLGFTASIAAWCLSFGCRCQWPKRSCPISRRPEKAGASATING